jgi:hypothetical protein
LASLRERYSDINMPSPERAGSPALLQTDEIMSESHAESDKNQQQQEELPQEQSQEQPQEQPQQHLQQDDAQAPERVSSDRKPVELVAPDISPLPAKAVPGPRPVGLSYTFKHGVNSSAYTYEYVIFPIQSPSLVSRTTTNHAPFIHAFDSLVTVHSLRDDSAYVWKTATKSWWITELFSELTVRQLDYTYAVDESATIFQSDGIEVEARRLLKELSEHRSGDSGVRLRIKSGIVATTILTFICRQPQDR